MWPGPVGSSGHGPAPSMAPVGRKTVGIAGSGRTQHPSLSVDSPHTCSKGTPPKFYTCKRSTSGHTLGVPGVREPEGASQGLWDTIQRIIWIMLAPGFGQPSPRE